MSGHGFYKMHRGWLDHPMFGREPYCRRAAWAWLVDRAAFKETSVPVGGKTITVRRGQLCFSLRFLADAWGWELTKVRRFLKKLESCRTIATATATATATGQTLITICNYDRYQAIPNGSATAEDTPPDPEPPQIRKKGKNDKEDTSLREGAGAPSNEIGKAVPESGGPKPDNPDTQKKEGERVSDLDKLLYDRGKALLGRNAGSQITRLKAAVGVGKALEVLERAKGKSDPGQYVWGVIASQGRGPSGAGFDPEPALTPYQEARKSWHQDCRAADQDGRPRPPEPRREDFEEAVA